MEQNEIDEKLLLYLLDEADEIVREDVEIWLAESERNNRYRSWFRWQHCHQRYQARYSGDRC